MRKCIAAAGIAIALGGGARADEEGQWIFRETFPNGEDGPVAVYLSYDYAWVVARVTCARATHELVLDYVEERTVEPTEAISLVGERSLDLATSFNQGWMTGRIAIDAKLLRLLDESQELRLWQPDGENEWDLGRAEALRKVVQRCR